MAWDVLSGVAEMAWDVLSGVTKTAWDVLSWVANLCGMFCPGCQKMAWDVLSRGVLSGSWCTNLSVGALNHILTPLCRSPMIVACEYHRLGLRDRSLFKCQGAAAEISIHHPNFG